MEETGETNSAIVNRNDAPGLGIMDEQREFTRLFGPNFPTGSLLITHAFTEEIAQAIMIHVPRCGGLCFEAVG